MIDKLDTGQVVMSLLALLISYVIGIVTWLKKDMKKLKSKIEERTLKVECKELREDCEKDCEKSRVTRDACIQEIKRGAKEEAEGVRKELQKDAHKHADSGVAGEVVK